MAIDLTLPAAGFSIMDLADIVDFILTDGRMTSGSPTGFKGGGTFDGAPVSFIATGSGFGLGNLGGELYLVRGVIDSLSFTTAAGTITFSSVGIDMSEFAPIILEDAEGCAPLGIERFLMAQGWNISLGDADDVAGRDAVIGDGARFNLTGNDTIHGRGGNDDLFGGDGRDWLFGDAGEDRLDGGLGHDRLSGGIGADHLIGGSGRDVLQGKAGSDRLDGGGGDDALTGGLGADKFVFRDNGGNDRITDFDAARKGEHIDLSGVTAITSFEDLVNNHMQQVGGDVVIDDHAGTRITLLNVDLADLDQGDFLF